MPVFLESVIATNVSDAWVEALRMVSGASPSHGFHLVIRIAQPTGETKFIREQADRFLAERNLAGIDAVRNTVFPAELASTVADPLQLIAEYKEIYPTLKLLSKSNVMGTYFGRMLGLDTIYGDQLSDIIVKLRRSISGDRAMSSTYELAALDAPIYAFDKDHKKQRAFPCLSFCSFHLDGDALHLTAHYRNEYLAQRGYGNLLGLGQLLGYLAQSLGLRTGELLVHCGRVEVDGGLSDVRELLTDLTGALRNRR